MKIDGYTYVQHRLVSRLSGDECQFTVADEDDEHINMAIPVPDIKIGEEDLAKLILAALLAKSAVSADPSIIDPIAEAVAAKEAEIKALLVEKELITVDQKIEDVKTKTEYEQTTIDEVVKP